MATFKNITPEERKNAISTIEKVGEQVTDERIEYYVKLRRNTIKHQEEKAIKEGVGQITEQIKEFARKVLSYMGRSTSDRQILVYSRKHIETLSYIKANNLGVDYTPSIFGEAIRFMEGQKSTTIHHITAEEIANCLKDKKEELLINRNQTEAKKKEWQSKSKKEINANEGGKAVRIAKITFWLGVALVFSPFFITGFGFGWFWYLIIVGIAFFTALLWGEDGKSQGAYSINKTILIGFCGVGCIMCLWGPLNPNYSYSSNGDSDNPYNMPKEYHTEPCERCGEVGTYYIAEDGTRTGDRRYALHGHWFCSSCYEIRKKYSDALGF